MPTAPVVATAALVEMVAFLLISGAAAMLALFKGASELRRLFRASHDGMMRCQLCREMRRRQAAGRGVRLAPVERRSEVRAASAARDARIPHGGGHYTSRARSRNRQNAFARRICCGVRQSGSNNRGLPTRTHNAFARDVATFKRFAL